MKTVLVKALFGNYDYWADPLHIYPNTDYYLFTDQDVQSDVFTVIKMMGDVKTQRQIKIEPWIFLRQDYDQYIWMDANIFPTSQLPESPEADIIALSHPGRSCAYQEASACVQLGKLSLKDAQQQMSQYHNEGFPKNYGMVQTGVMIRTPSDQVKEHSRLWMEQITKYTHRDQLSFNYALWKMENKPTIQTIDFKSEFFKYWKLIHHKKFSH